jgi:excisionase family DNA binding protein
MWGVENTMKNIAQIELENTERNGGHILFSDTRPLWTIKEVAEFLRLKPETVRMMARKENLPAIKVGRVWRFNRNEIVSWVSNNSSKEA